MTDTSNKPAASDAKESSAQPPVSQESWRPFEGLRRQIDRLFDDFDRSWHRPGRHSLETTPFWQGGLGRMPAVDVVEKDHAFEITAELPGMDQADIEVKLVGDTLIIKGEKRQERKEEKQGYHLSERSFGTSSAVLPCRTESTVSRSTPASARACCRSHCRRSPAPSQARKPSRSKPTDNGATAGLMNVRPAVWVSPSTT